MCGHAADVTVILLTFDNVRHEASLQHEPDAPGDVEEHGLRAQEDGHPLIIRVVQPTKNKRDMAANDRKD